MCTIRRIVVVLIVVQILLPALMLAVRVSDPSVGQVPFGWQMHTSCWERDDPCR